MLNTVREGWFWGNALNPLVRGAAAVPVGSGWRIDDGNRFCSGAADSDRLLLSAWPAAAETPLIAAVDSDRDGILIHADWDNNGPAPDRQR